MRAALVIPLLAVLLFGACATDNVSTTAHTEPIASEIDVHEVVLSDTEEDWCNTLEGKAGGWLAADDLELGVDDPSGESLSIGPDTRRLLEIVASEGVVGVDSDELSQLDTFLRLPLPSPLACRTAFEAHDG